MATRKPEDRRYWLFKSEPETYGFAHLVRDRRTSWGGVRNYQARNLLKAEIQKGDGVLFYHSNADPTAIVGIAKVVKAGYPDPTQFDPASPYCDPDSPADAPRWYCVDIEKVAPLATPLSRDQMKAEPGLAGMMVLKKGARLSVQPVTVAEWRRIVELGGVDASW